MKATTAAYLELDQLSLVRSSSFSLVAMFLKVGAVLTAFFFYLFYALGFGCFVQMNAKTTKGKIEASEVAMERAKVLRDQGYLDDRHNQRVCLEQ